MASVFLKDYDDLLESILTAYQNLDSSPDVTAGSITFIKAACLASMLWGLYKYQDYVSNQIFPDVCDNENLNHHGAVLGIARLATDTDETYRSKILAFLQQPPAGGNKLDYVNWSMATPGATGSGATGVIYVGSATVITPDSGLVGPGNVSVTIMPDANNGVGVIGSTGMYNLIGNSTTYLNSVRPVTANQMTIQAPMLAYIYIDVKVTAPTGVILDLVQMTSDVTSYISNLKPGDGVYISKLQSICIEDGALNALVLSPVADSLASPYWLIQASSINVHL